MWDNHRLLNQIATSLYALAAAAIVYALVSAGIRSPVFALREVEVTGETAHTTRAQVQSLAARELRGTFFTLELEQASATFMKLPWVRVAQVRRVWPDRLHVTVQEHVPLARWNGKALVNLQGEVFISSSEMLPSPRRIRSARPHPSQPSTRAARSTVCRIGCSSLAGRPQGQK